MAAHRALPLEGVVVVSCEQAVAAPLATRHLADLGARVIKVERPGRGDFARDYDTVVGGLSSHFVWLNRSKESVTARPQGPRPARRAVKELIAGAPTCSSRTSRPGAAERLGLGADELRRRPPAADHCSISGYGSTGPYRDAKAYDLLIQAETGLMSVTGTEEYPAKAGIPAADIGAGMYAFSGILAALYDRERTGEGTHVRGQPVRRARRVDGLPAALRARAAGTRRCGPGRATPPSPPTARSPRATAGGRARRSRTSGSGSVLRDRARRRPDRRRRTVRHRLRPGGEPPRPRRGRSTGCSAASPATVRRAARGGGDRERAPPQLDRGARAPAARAAGDRCVEVGTPNGTVRTLLPPITFADGRVPRMDPVPDIGPEV